MKILDFFRKKSTEEDSTQETNTESSPAHIIYEQEKIDEMLQNPGFEVYKPFLRVHRDELAKRWAVQIELRYQTTYNWHYEMVRTTYYQDIIAILIHNINLYIRTQHKEPINFGSLELFLLEVLAAELKITEVSVAIDESEIENMMECNDMRILYRNFMEARNHWIKTDTEVIIDLIYKYDRCRALDGRFYRKTPIDEIRNLVNDPDFPDGYTEFALYNDHLLYTTWKDFRNQVDPDIALSKYIELVYDIVVWTHVCRVDSKHKESRSTNGLIRYAYNHALIDACLKEHVCWFPSEEQTKNIIARMPEEIDEMNTISTVEKPFGEELPESVKDTGKKEETVLPTDDWNPVEKSWDEFRNTGLVQITNQFLHIFGWALTYAKDGDELRVFPARVRYRGFDVGSQTRAYEKLQKYMIENAETLYKESDYEDEEN